MKKISVVIPTYNEKADTFDKSLRSILNQTYTNLQIVIIVDNPNNDEIINYRYLDHSKIFNNTMLDTTRARNFCAFKWNIKNTK